MTAFLDDSIAHPFFFCRGNLGVLHEELVRRKACEWFYMPSMFLNENNLPLGPKQAGEAVNDAITAGLISIRICADSPSCFESD